MKARVDQATQPQKTGRRHHFPEFYPPKSYRINDSESRNHTIGINVVYQAQAGLNLFSV